MNVDLDALIQEAANQMANVSSALASRCALLAGQPAAAQKEIETLKRQVAELQKPQLKQ